MRVVGRLSEPAQFDNIILKTNADGTLVRLRDVGHAELGAESYANDLQFNGQDAVGLGVTSSRPRTRSMWTAGRLPSWTACRRASPRHAL